MADLQIRPGEAWEYCPRNALRKVTKVLLDEFNVVRINPHFLCLHFQMPFWSHGSKVHLFWYLHLVIYPFRQ